MPDPFELRTDAIDSRGFFDPRYSCDFDNSSPELRWSGEPEGCAGYALIAEDPDARDPHASGDAPFIHWIVYNIPPQVHHLPAGIPAQETLPNGIHQGVSSFGKLGFGGPCPPPGDPPHRYVFRLHALRMLPRLETRASRAQVLAAIEGLVLATAELTGRYQRAIEKAG
jgi:Raf kinase inhibitor-like YbhB/YbcL family protein